MALSPKMSSTSLNLKQNNNTNKRNPYKRLIASGAKQLAKAVVDKVKTKSAQKAASHAINGVVQRSAAPSNTSFKFRSPIPHYTGVKDGIRIRHTEYVQDMQSSSTTKAFHASKFVLNPANSDTFPWLSDQATSYATYKFHSLSFRIGSLVSTATDGMFGLCATPDITDAIPTNKTNFMQYENAVRNNVWQAATYVVPKDVLHRLPEYLTAVTGVGDTDSTKQMGALFLCSQGLTGTSVDFGELYVSYDVELIHPQSPNSDALHFESTPETGNLWHTNNVLKVPSTIFASPLNNAGVFAENSLVIQAAGDFLVVVVTTNTTANPTFGAVDNFGTTVAIDSVANVNNTTTGINFFKVRDAPKPWYLTSSGGTYASNPTANVYITRYFNFETEGLTVVDALSKRLAKLEKLVEPFESDDEMYQECVPKPPTTPVVKKFFGKIA